MKLIPVYTPQLDGYAKHLDSRDGYAIDGYVGDGYTTTITSEPILVGLMAGYSVVFSCPSTGSPAGTVKLQGCNDKERIPELSDPDNLVHWFDVASGGNRVVSQSVSGAGAYFLTDPDCAYRWMRIVYTRSSGSITATAKVQGKSSRN